MKLAKATSIASIVIALSTVGIVGCATSSGAPSIPSSKADYATNAAHPNGNNSTNANSASSATQNKDIQSVTGTIVNTTYAEQAKTVGYNGPEFTNDNSILTLLILDSPIKVSSNKGGNDWTGEISVIKLPNDEMFRQFKDQQVTIEVNKWGAVPADVAGFLYDVVLDFDDGLVLE